MKYADVSEANLFYGNMRFDVNVSVSKDPLKMGTRTETKNLNSFRSVHDAVNYEIQRQIDVLESGGTVVQETRGWLDDAGKTFSQRSKEDAHDYRYFPDPDIPPVVLQEEFIKNIETTMPTMPWQLRQVFGSLKLEQSQVETIIDEPQVASMLLYIQDAHGDATAKTVANWLSGPIQKLVLDEKASWRQVSDASSHFGTLAAMLSESKVSSTAAKDILSVVILENTDPMTVAEKLNLLQVSDTAELEKIVSTVLKDNKKASDDIIAGEMKAIGFLVGQVMKASGGKANPGMVQQIIKKQLGV
jgi:aspartyl-tRNA(Asn)/glutamyl-tRNA(Gln) amidotransferase subunit B